MSEESRAVRIHQFFEKWYQELVVSILSAIALALLTGIVVADNRMNTMSNDIAAIKASSQATSQSIDRQEQFALRLEGKVDDQDKKIQSNSERITRAETRLEIVGSKPVQAKEAKSDE